MTKKPPKTLTIASTPIVSNSEAMPGVRLIWLESPQIAAAAKPGQFVMVRCGKETLLRRPLSIHQVDESKTKLALLFNVVGKGTAWLSRRKAGDNIDLFGPMGNGYTIYPDSKNLLLVAGGIGIAPLYFLAQDAGKRGLSVTLLYGTAIENPYPVVSHDIKLIRATEDGSVGYHGLVTDLLPDFTEKADQVFACGPLPMYKTMARVPELKNTPVQLSLEIMMGCGKGVCYGCTVKTKNGLKQVCKDGPVFELEDIIWEELGGV
ncbi:dihydroorotate dehydrogenase electron transfer subunit [Chloroflexota bacterium]